MILQKSMYSNKILWKKWKTMRSKFKKASKIKFRIYKMKFRMKQKYRYQNCKITFSKTIQKWKIQNHIHYVQILAKWLNLITKQRYQTLWKISVLELQYTCTCSSTRYIFLFCWLSSTCQLFFCFCPEMKEFTEIV